MEKDDNKYGAVPIDIKNILVIFRKRIWWFVGAFLIILIAGLIFNIFVARDFQYRASSVMTIPTDNLKYQRRISEEYPQESSDLWLIKEGKATNGYFNHYFTAIPLEINSEEFLNVVISNLDIDINLEHLKRLLLIEYGGNESFFTINTFYRNPEDAKKINETIIDTFTYQKEKSFKIIYDELIDKVKGEIAILEKDLSELSTEAEEYAINFNKQLIKNLNVENNITIELKSTGFISPELESEIRIISGRTNFLKEILDSLVKNEELYTNSIEYVAETSVDENFTHFRNILLSVIAALVIGIIFVYIIDFIISNKRRGKDR